MNDTPTDTSSSSADQASGQTRRLPRILWWMVVLAAIVGALWFLYPKPLHELVHYVTSDVPSSRPQVMGSSPNKEAQAANQRAQAAWRDDIADLRSDMTALSQRVDQQEEALSQLEQRMQQASAANEPSTAPHANEMNASEVASDTRASLPIAETALITAMQQQIDQMQRQLTDVEQKSRSQMPDSFRLLASLWQIERDVAQGMPFRRELVAFKQQLVMMQGDSTAQLMLEQAGRMDSMAPDGVKTPLTLYWSFQQMAGRLASSLNKSGDTEGWWPSLSELIDVRKIAMDDDPSSIDAMILRIDTYLERAEITAAAREAELLAARMDDQQGIPVPLRDLFRRWQRELQATVEVQRALDELFALLLEQA